MKTVLLLDGGYLRATAQNAGVNYDVQFIENFSRRCFDPNEYLLRILNYDAPQYDGVVQLPVSGKNKMFKSKDTLLDDLAKLERFACRKGSLGFRGWKPRSIPIAGGSPLTDSDFQPVLNKRASICG
jgi:hypothetical protein